MLEEDIELGEFFDLATTIRKYVNGLNLQETKNEFSGEYTGDFELIGSMLIRGIKKTKIRFKKVDDFETHINAIDSSGYYSDDVVLQYGCLK